ncbi:hypothetical protein K2X85_14690 [bacterium]|nr:hypothetical protein [bacterium]
MNLLSSILFLSVLLPTDDVPKLESGKQPFPKQVAQELSESLAPASYTILEDGKEVLRFWIRKLVPSAATPGGIVGYDSIEDGTFLGIFEVIDDSFSDFRGQTIPVGIYTLRLATHPQDGNHMGIAPSPAFALLSPLDEDQKLDAVSRDDLMERSKKAAKTGHPCALFLDPFVEAPTEPLPRVRENEQKHVVLDVSSKAKLESEEADLPLGIVFIGKTEAE